MEIWGIRGSEQERRGLSDAYSGDFGDGTMGRDRFRSDYVNE